MNSEIGLFGAIWTDFKNRVFYFLVNPQKQDVVIRQTSRTLLVKISSPNPYFIKAMNDMVYEALASYEEGNPTYGVQEKEPAIGRTLGFDTKEMFEDDDD